MAVKTESDWRTKQLAALLPIPEDINAMVARAKGSILSIAHVRTVISPSNNWKFDPDLSYLHSFRLIDPAIKNGRDPNTLSGVGPTANLTVTMARIPESAIEEIAQSKRVIHWSHEPEFIRTPGGLVMRHMRAYHMLAEPTPGLPVAAIYSDA